MFIPFFSDWHTWTLPFACWLLYLSWIQLRVSLIRLLYNHRITAIACDNNDQRFLTGLSEANED